jgi:fucose 4-O-acetylase-like acetyltransferase
MKFFITQGIFRLAVPFFFVASGYFLGSKIIRNPENMNFIYKKYIKRLLMPLVFFSLINVLLESIKMSSYMSGPVIFREIIRHMVFYPWGALWFVQACIVGALLLYPFVKRSNFIGTFLVASLLYSWALVCNNYFFVVQGTFLEPYIRVFMNLCFSARNGVFVGFVYLAIGFFIARRNTNVSVLFTIIVISVYFLEIVLLKDKASLDDSALYISQLLIVPIIFIKSYNFPLNISEETSLMLRNFSVGMYLLHRPVISLLDILDADYIPKTIVVYIFCSGICYLVHRKGGRLKRILF